MGNFSTYYIRGFKSPGMYIQGRGVLVYLGKLVKRFGKRALVLSDKIVWNIVGSIIGSSLKNFDIHFIYSVFGGECSWNEINRISSIAIENGVDMVIGIGGGKALDTAKAVAIPNGLAAVMVPTIASTDAPITAHSVIYTEPYPGKLLELLFFPRNPDIIIVDTEVIAKAPPRFLAAGMGDAASHYWEARATFAGNKSNFVYMDYNGRKGVEPLKPFDVGFIFASHAWEILRRHGVLAMDSARTRVVTPSLDMVVYANTLLSGLAVENCGTALAHAVGNGLSALEEKMKPMQYHGEMVAFGTLVEIVAEDPPMIQEYICWAHSIGLPITLQELGLENVTGDELYQIAERAKMSLGFSRIPYEIMPERLVELIKIADKIGRKLGERCPRQPYS